MKRSELSTFAPHTERNEWFITVDGELVGLDAYINNQRRQVEYLNGCVDVKNKDLTAARRSMIIASTIPASMKRIGVRVVARNGAYGPSLRFDFPVHGRVMYLTDYSGRIRSAHRTEDLYTVWMAPKDVRFDFRGTVRMRLVMSSPPRWQLGPTHIFQDEPRKRILPAIGHISCYGTIPRVYDITRLDQLVPTFRSIRNLLFHMPVNYIHRSGDRWWDMRESFYQNRVRWRRYKKRIRIDGVEPTPVTKIP